MKHLKKDKIVAPATKLNINEFGVLSAQVWRLHKQSNLHIQKSTVNLLLSFRDIWRAGVKLKKLRESVPRSKWRHQVPDIAKIPSSSVDWYIKFSERYPEVKDASIVRVNKVLEDIEKELKAASAPQDTKARGNSLNRGK